MYTMKIKLYSLLGALISFMLLLVSCSDEKEEATNSVTEMFRVFMFVTNEANEDLILNSKNYYPKGHTMYAEYEEFGFDTWEVYLDGKLIQTEGKDNKYCYKSVNFGNLPGIVSKYISLDTNSEMQLLNKDWSDRHVLEYVITSFSLFGNTAEHNIRMEFKGLKNDNGGVTKFEYSISVDGVQQEVFYPIYWSELFPKSQYESINFPYFILNVDSL